MTKNVNQIINKNEEITQSLITVQPVRPMNTTHTHICSHMHAHEEGRGDIHLLDST